MTSGVIGRQCSLAPWQQLDHRVLTCSLYYQLGFLGHIPVSPASFHTCPNILQCPLASRCLIKPADCALEDSAVCLALWSRRRQWNGQWFQSHHSSWLKPNMTDLPLGRLFHLLFNACNKYLHDPVLEGTLCDNSLHFPAKRHRNRIPELWQRIFYAVLRTQVTALW